MLMRIKIPQVLHKAAGDLVNPHHVQSLPPVQGQDLPASYPGGQWHGRVEEARSLQTKLCHSAGGRLAGFGK